MGVPDLVTPRLRPRGLSDMDALLEMDADPEVMRLFSSGRRTNIEAFRAELTRNISTDTVPGLGYFSIFAQPELSRFPGYVSLHHLPDWPEIRLGSRLVRAAWGRGFASEASRAVLGHRFGMLGLGEIVAAAHPENFASQAVMGRLEFTPGGRRMAYGREHLLFRLPAPAHVDANLTRDARTIS
jgi:RimJ/RimL family protein N-acetyltransferase